METYYKKYKRLLNFHKISVILYFVMALFLLIGCLVGICVCSGKNTDSLIGFFVILGIVGPVVMFFVYIFCIQSLWNKRLEKQNNELKYSDLSAEEIIELGMLLKTNLYSIALEKRCNELGIDHVPEGYIRDAILPKAEDFAD